MRMATEWRKAHSSLFQNSPRLPQSLHLLARKHMQRPTRRQIIPVDSEFWGIKANSRQSFSLLVVQHECQGSKTNATIYFPATPTRDGAKMQWFDQISNIVWSSGWHSCRAQTPTRGRKQHHLIFLLNLKLVKNNLHNLKKNYSPPVFYALCLEKVCKHVRLRQDKHFTSENVRINQEVPYIIIYGWIDIYEYIIFQI